MSDPFSQIHLALWAQLESHTGFTDMVKVGNRVKKTDLKQRLMPNDAPRVGIFPAPGGGVDLFQTSSASRFVQNFSVEMQTNNQWPEDALFPLKWEIVKAMAKADDQLGMPSLVTKVRITDAAESREDAAGQSAGWAGVLTISVEFRVANTTLTGE